MVALLLTATCCCVIVLTSANHGSPSSFSDEDLEVRESQSVFASCQASDNGVSDIYWSKPDGQLVEEDPESYVFSSHENEQLLLIIQEANEATEGEYICWEVWDGEETVRERFTFHVSTGSPPRFEQEYELVEVYEGTNATLVCEALGDHPMEYSWLDQHSSIISNSTPDMVIYKRSNHSELHLRWVSEETSGIYTCTATNRLGTESKLFQIAVQRKEDGFPPFFNESRVEIQGFTNKSLTLTCQADGKPRPKYSWYNQYNEQLNRSHPRVIDLDRLNDTSEIPVGNSSILVSNRNGSLTFVQLKLSDAGNYRCNAENSLGTASKMYRIYVNDSEDEFPPFFNESRVEIQGFEYKSLTLTCQAAGNPRPTYMWYNQYGEPMNRFRPRVIDLDRLNDTSEIPMGNSSILVSNRNGSLTFVQLKLSDAGHYTCYAENPLGKAAKTYRIYVNDSEDGFPPFFNKSREEIQGFENKSLTLICQAAGNPRPTYIWYNKNNELLNRYHPRVIDLDRLNDTSEIPMSNSSILVSSRNGSLTFVQLLCSDAGRYTCYAENPLGRDRKTYEIYVNDSQVSDDYITVAVLNITDSSVTFALYSPGSSAVRGFEARYKLIDKRDFSSIYWSVEEEHKVSNLLPGAKYVFQFKLRSAYNWTNPITVALPPGPPEIIVRQVTSQSVRMEFFRPFYLYTYNSIEKYIIKYRTVQQVGGNTWSYSSCEVTITLPSCRGSYYEISNLQTRVYYSITVQVVGPAGYSRPSEMKVYVP